jgi:hypothetical protein
LSALQFISKKTKLRAFRGRRRRSNDEIQPEVRLVVAMLAPYFSGLLVVQSDFGHPAGAVLGDAIVSDFSPKSGLWRGSRHRHAACGGFVLSVTDTMED